MTLLLETVIVLPGHDAVMSWFSLDIMDKKDTTEVTALKERVEEEIRKKTV